MSSTDICNRAAQKLGAKRVSSLSENSVMANNFNQSYELILDAFLEEHRWSFAIKRAEIAADAPAPDWGRENSFTLPSDFLKLIPRYEEDESVDKDWLIEGKKIITDDASPIYIRYIYKVRDTNEMTSLFKEALATKIAFELCEVVTQSNSKKEGLKQDLKDLISQAKKSSAIQNVAAKSPDDTWLAVRG